MKFFYIGQNHFSLLRARIAKSFVLSQLTLFLFCKVLLVNLRQNTSWNCWRVFILAYRVPRSTYIYLHIDPFAYAGNRSPLEFDSGNEVSFI